MHNENWDDLRYVLAVAATGSVLRAAKELGVNHATVLRHVAAFEDRHGVKVFEKTPQGYRLLPDQTHVITAAQEAETAMREVSRLASGGRIETRTAVTIASTDTLCTFVLSGFGAVENSVALTLVSSNRHIDLQRTQAELIVRPAPGLPDDLVGEPVADLGLAAYAQSDAVTDWLTPSGPLARSIGARWMADNIPDDRMSVAADSFLALCELAALGRGIAVLPCFIGDHDRRLKRLPAAMPHMTVPVWVAHPADLHLSTTLRRVKTHLGSYLATKQDWLHGSRA